MMTQVETTPSSYQATVDTARLPFCPMCEYDLTGLPARHRCPECGFAYDERTRIWWNRSQSRVTSYTILILQLALIALILFFLPKAVSMGAEFLIMYLLNGIGLGLTVCTWIRHQYHWLFHRQWVGFCPKGVIVRIAKAQTKIIPWVNLARKKPIDSGWLGTVIIRPKDGKPIDVAAAFNGRNEIEAFVQDGKLYCLHGWIGQ